MDFLEMTPIQIVGNILCLFASIIMILLGLIKKKSRFLIAQCGMNGFFIAGNLCFGLGGISGAVANLVTMTRNLVCLKWNLNTPLKIIFIVLQIGLTLLFQAIFGQLSFSIYFVIMWMPVIAICVFTWFMDTQNMILIKAICIGAQILWAIYDFTNKNYTTTLFDIAAVITNIVGIFMILKDRKKQEA